jgi:hypothetical protein
MVKVLEKTRSDQSDQYQNAPITQPAHSVTSTYNKKDKFIGCHITC